jgi:hypothetical protein
VTTSVQPTYVAGPLKRRRRTKAKMQEYREAAFAVARRIQPASIRANAYQQFVLGLTPNMSKTVTNQVSSLLTRAREHGVIPWPWIVDENRAVERTPSWDDPAEYSEAVVESWRRDRWAQQSVRIEIWSEKGTIRGTLGPVLREYGVGFRVMHGYTSATVVHDVALQSRQDHRPLIALYAGDFDPSGLHMSEVDLPGRLAEYDAKNVTLRRLALSNEDVTDSALPWFSAETKRSDTRYRWFVPRYGGRCWELDALDPNVLRARVEATIMEYIDWPSWDRCALAEAAERQSLVEVMGAWKDAAGVAS